MNKAFDKILEFIDEQIKIEESIAKSENEGHPITHQYGANCMNVIKKFVQEVAEEYNNGWIACSERLPEEPFGCLVTVMDCEPSTQTDFENILPYFVGYDGHSWNDEDGEEIPFEGIAWMPLPEPYQSKGE